MLEWFFKLISHYECPNWLLCWLSALESAWTLIFAQEAIAIIMDGSYRCWWGLQVCWSRTQVWFYLQWTNFFKEMDKFMWKNALILLIQLSSVKILIWSPSIDVSLYWFYPTAVITGLMGDFLLTMSCINAYVADKFEDKKVVSSTFFCYLRGVVLKRAYSMEALWESCYHSCGSGQISKNGKSRQK